MTDNPEWTGPSAPDQAQLRPLSQLEAYDAMRHFIEAYWERGLKSSDDIANLLSNIDRSGLWGNGSPNDPAMWGDWLEAVAQAKR